MGRLRATVLISGSGSNLQAMIDARLEGRLSVDIGHVVSNVADAPGLERAQKAGIATSVLEHGGFQDRNDFDRALSLLVAADHPDLVVLAGFMRIVGPELLERFPGRMINLHPSLLPLYRGTDTYRRAIDAGDRRHGASIHFVTEELDGGPVISQAIIPIRENDDAKALAARLSPVEHRLVVATVEFFATHKVECSDGYIRVDGKNIEKPLLLQPDDTLENQAP